MTTSPSNDARPESAKQRWYPLGPPALPGETDAAYTDRLTDADRTGRRPYDHRRNRQCSIGWHNECSDRDHSGQCECPHHDEVRNAAALVAAWNARVPVGTVVSFVEGTTPAEPPAATTSTAYVCNEGRDAGWPVVELEGFPRPVWLSWLVKP